MPSAWAISSSASSRGLALTRASRAAAAFSASRAFIEAGEPLGLVLGDQGVDQFVEPGPCEDLGRAGGGSG